VEEEPKTEAEAVEVEEELPKSKDSK